MAKRSAAASLSVTLIAKTKAFTKGLRKAKKAIKSLTRPLGKIAKLAAAVGAAWIALALRMAKTADQAIKTSQKLGLSVNALQALRYAAQLTGVEIRQLDMGIQRMTRRIAEAAKDTGEAKEAIKTLGLDAKQLAAQSPDVQFLAIADAMSKVQEQGERVRLGFKLFDSEGVALINTLKGGAEQIRKAYKAIRESGNIISGQQSRVFEDMVDRVERLKLSLKGMGRAITDDLVPVIDEWAESFTHFLDDHRLGVREMVQEMIAYARVVGHIPQMLFVIQRRLGEMIGKFALAINPILRTLGINELGPEFAKFADAMMEDAEEEIKRILNSISANIRTGERTRTPRDDTSADPKPTLPAAPSFGVKEFASSRFAMLKGTQGNPMTVSDDEAHRLMMKMVQIMHKHLPRVGTAG